VPGQQCCPLKPTEGLNGAPINFSSTLGVLQSNRRATLGIQIENATDLQVAQNPNFLLGFADQQTCSWVVG
jgi:hypothetical protein